MVTHGEIVRLLFRCRYWVEFCSAYEQGCLLTIEEPALMVNRTPTSGFKRIKEYQEEHRVVLLIKGNKLDMGPGIIYKRIILELSLHPAYTGSSHSEILVFGERGDAEKSRYSAIP